MLGNLSDEILLHSLLGLCKSSNVIVSVQRQKTVWALIVMRMHRNLQP